MRHLPDQRNNINALTVVSGDSKWKKVIETESFMMTTNMTFIIKWFIYMTYYICRRLYVNLPNQIETSFISIDQVCNFNVQTIIYQP